MPSIREEDLTPFGRLSLKLDRELAELARAGEQISGVNLETDNGMDEGVKILNRVAKYGESVAVTMHEFSKALQEAREKAEAATAVVSERAQLIQKRKNAQNALEEKLEKLKADVQSTGAGLSGFDMTDKAKVAAELARLQSPMNAFVEAAKAVKADAANGNFKRLERQADSMIDSLQSTLRKITQAIS